MRDSYGRTVLHLVCESLIGEGHVEVIKELVICGGKELILARDFDNDTALHLICQFPLPSIYRNEVINLLLDVGGEELLLIRNLKTLSAIDLEGRRIAPSQLLLDRLIEVGGESILMPLATVGGEVEYRDWI